MKYPLWPTISISKKWRFDGWNRRTEWSNNEVESIKCQRILVADLVMAFSRRFPEGSLATCGSFPKLSSMEKWTGHGVRYFVSRDYHFGITLEGNVNGRDLKPRTTFSASISCRVNQKMKHRSTGRSNLLSKLRCVNKAWVNWTVGRTCILWQQHSWLQKVLQIRPQKVDAWWLFPIRYPSLVLICANWLS